MIRSIEPGLRQVKFYGRFAGRGLAVVVIALMTVGGVAVSDALASPRPSRSGTAGVTRASLVASTSTLTTALACEAAKTAVVVTLATDTAAPQADSNADDHNDSGEADPAEVARTTKSVENGVLVVRHVPTEEPQETRDDAGDQALSAADDAATPRRRAIVCGDDSPWPCDPLGNVRGPAEGFHKNERWAYHRLSFKYHATDFTYHPKSNFTYHPIRASTYRPKRDWTYHPKHR